MLLDGVGVLAGPQADRQGRWILVRDRGQAIQLITGKGAEAIEFRFKMTEEIVRQIVPKQRRRIAIGAIQVGAARIRDLGGGDWFRSHDRFLHVTK